MKHALYGILVLPIVVSTACGSNTADSTASAPSTRTSSTTASASPTAAATDCDAAAISSDLGYTYTVERCHGDWALIDTGGLGDSISLARLVDGKWTSYTAFPTGICKAQAEADGVPEQELVNFTTC
jgi:hypothetical protein